MMQDAVARINSVLWSPALIVLCLGVSAYFSVRTKFLQIRLLPEMLRLLFSQRQRESSRGISAFQALSVSLSYRVGTGNIVGVAIAIEAGGPGALFWMWTIGFLGAATSFVECSLGQLYKVKEAGRYIGGPPHYIARGLNNKIFAVVFAIANIASVGFLHPGIQANSITSSFQLAFGVDPMLVIFCLSLVFLVIVVGGVKRISHVAEWVVPFMALGYIGICAFVLAFHLPEIPGVLRLIFASAFGLEPVYSGILGATISWGVRRGLFSNSAGQGQTPQIAAAAEADHPAEQGLLQALSVYIDTLIVCTCTGLVILVSGLYNVKDGVGGFLVENVKNLEAGAMNVQNAIDLHTNQLGSPFLAIAILLFAFTTILSFYFIAESNLGFLLHGKKLRIGIWALRVLVILSLVNGGTQASKLAWSIGDIGVGLTAWINVIALVFLASKGLKLLKDYESQKASGEVPKLFAKKFGFKDTENIWY